MQDKEAEEVNVGWCELGNMGCLLVIRGEWTKLKVLNLGNYNNNAGKNYISDYGCKYLIQGKWPLLT